MHEVQMHAFAISKLSYGFASILAIAHALSLCTDAQTIR